MFSRHVGPGKAFSGSGSGNWPTFPSIWVAKLTAYTETINHSFFLQKDWGLWLLPSRELPLLKSPPGLAVNLQPASLFCCTKCTHWGCRLLLLAHLHQSAGLTWSLYVSPFFTPLLPQSGFQDHVLQDSGESYLNKQGKKFSCLVKYIFVDSESFENPMETSDQGNYIGQVQVLQNTGWASKTARGKWQQSWGQWQGKCQVVMGNSGHQEAEDWHCKVLRQSSPGGIVLKAASKIKTKCEEMTT